MKQAASRRPLPCDEELGAAVEINAAEWLRLQGRLPWVEFHDDGDVLRVFAGDTYPSNTVALARFTPANASRRVGEILQPHLEQRAACNWIVGPVSQPGDLARHLKGHGFSCRIHCAGMACMLDALGQSPPLPKGILIELVDTPRPLLPLTTERRQRRHKGRTIMARFTPRKVWHFSATLDGLPVGETTLLGGATVAGLYDVDVLERFRRRGIGSALVHAALRHGKKLGYRAAVLGATGTGASVYAQAGFREVCKLSFWKYGKMRQLADVQGLTAR